MLQCTKWRDPYHTCGRIEIGEGTIIQPFAYLNSCGGTITLGRQCSVNSFAVLYGLGGLTIGNKVRIAAHTVIIPANHVFSAPEVAITDQGSSLKGVRIDDDVWIGAGAKILDGVHVAEGCVIGAGAVVTKSTEAFGVYVGVPARRIRERGPADHVADEAGRGLS